MNKKWNDNCLRLKAKWSKDYFEEYALKSKDEILTLSEVISYLSMFTNEENIVMADAGSPSYAMPQSFHSKSVKCVYSPSQADMGFALPASIGVAMSAPHKTVIAVIGDGSFMSNIQELSTVKYHNLNIIFLVINNNGYLSIKNTQSKFYNGRIHGTNSSNGVALPESYKSIVEGFHIPHTTIFNRKDLVNIVKSIENKKGPEVIEIFTDPNEEVLPAQGIKDGQQMPLDNMNPYLTHEEYDMEVKKCM